MAAKQAAAVKQAEAEVLMAPPLHGVPTAAVTLAAAEEPSRRVVTATAKQARPEALYPHSPPSEKSLRQHTLRAEDAEGAVEGAVKAVVQDRRGEEVARLGVVKAAADNGILPSTNRMMTDPEENRDVRGRVRPPLPAATRLLARSLGAGRGNDSPR